MNFEVESFMNLKVYILMNFRVKYFLIKFTT
jgi:hypothetical protein